MPFVEKFEPLGTGLGLVALSDGPNFPFLLEQALAAVFSAIRSVS